MDSGEKTRQAPNEDYSMKKKRDCVCFCFLRKSSVIKEKDWVNFSSRLKDLKEPQQLHTIPNPGLESALKQN